VLASLSLLLYWIALDPRIHTKSRERPLMNYAKIYVALVGVSCQ